MDISYYLIYLLREEQIDLLVEAPFVFLDNVESEETLMCEETR